MQHIQIILEDENGTPKAKSEVNFAEILAEVQKISDFRKIYKWVGCIGPYEDTIFSVAQIPHVITDLERLARIPALQKNAREIEMLASFLEQIGQHERARFIGD